MDKDTFVMNRSAKVQVQGGVLAYQGMVLEVETELVACHDHICDHDNLCHVRLGYSLA